MKKRQIANLIMIAVIVIVVTAGVLGVGHIRGWFDKTDRETAYLTDFRGIVNLEREGVAYPVEQDTSLRAGDKITCDFGASAVIRVGASTLTLGQQTGMEINDPAAQSFAAVVTGGEVFVNAKNTVTLSFDGKETGFLDAVAMLSVRSGAQSISVFAGSVGDAGAGQMLDWVGQTLQVADLSIQSLNDFCIRHLRLANADQTLCFSNEDLDELEEARRLALQQEAEQNMAASGQDKETEPTTESATEPATESTAEPATKPTAEPTTESTTKPATEPTTEPTTESTTAPTTEPTEAPTTEPAPTVSLSIRCDTILNNWDNLDPAKAGFVPSNGWILSTTVEITEGETVFDVLKRVCSAYGIQLEYSWSPMYNTYYVEGIHNLYEFDCGSESGWMYKVDGWFPNYGCSAYSLSGGESIVWCYTCNGLGADVGG